MLTEKYGYEEDDRNLLGLLFCQPRQIISEDLRSGSLLRNLK